MPKETMKYMWIWSSCKNKYSYKFLGVKDLIAFIVDNAQ